MNLRPEFMPPARQLLLLSLFPVLFFPQKKAPAPVVPDHDCWIENTAFQPGEELVYKVYYNWGFVWIPAGEATFRVHDAGDQYHFSVIGRTYKSYEWFFKVRDYYDTWVDKQTLLPTVSIRDVVEGGYTLYDKNHLDQQKHEVVNWRGRRPDNIREHNFFHIESCMHDMLSIVYWARNLDYEGASPGAVFSVKIFADKETWPLEFRYEGKESAKKVRNAGVFNTLKFSPEVIEGTVFPKDAHVEVWVSDDANRVPLIIESPLSVGSAKAVLKSHKGLRHPLTSQIENP